MKRGLKEISFSWIFTVKQVQQLHKKNKTDNDKESIEHVLGLFDSWSTFN